MSNVSVKIIARLGEKSDESAEFMCDRAVLSAMSAEFAQLLSGSADVIEVDCEPETFGMFADFVSDWANNSLDLPDIGCFTYEIADRLMTTDESRRNKMGMEYAQFCNKYFNEVRHEPLLSCIYVKLEHSAEIFREFLDLGIISDDPRCLYEFIAEVKKYYGSRIFEWIPQKYIERLLRYNAYADCKFPHISFAMTVEDMYYFVISDNFIGLNDNIKPIMKLFVEKCIDGSANIPHSRAGEIAKKIMNIA